MNLTQILIVAVIVGLLTYDGLVGKMSQPTESQVLRDWSLNWTLLPFVGGFLVGHWWFPVSHPFASGWMWALPSMLLIFVWDLYWNVLRWNERPWYRYPGIWAVLGIPVGACLWGQSL